MKNVRFLGVFKKDLRRIAKRGWDRDKLDSIVQMLQQNETLPGSARPHKLRGEWYGFWECHIEPDWLLIYDSNDKEVLLARTDSHADLFEH